MSVWCLIMKFTKGEPLNPTNLIHAGILMLKKHIRSCTCL